MSKKRTTEGHDSTSELLRDLLITSLGRAGVPQVEIRKIVGCDMNRVSRIVRHINKEA